MIEHKKYWLGLFVASLIIFGLMAHSASARVFLQHKRVTVTLTQAISAEPCDNPRGCVRGFVELRWGGDLVATHHIRCAPAPRMHVVKAWTGPTDWAEVYACHRLYRWGLS